MTMGPLLQIPVGVVLARHRARSQWIDYTWKPVSVLPGIPEVPPWTQLGAQGDAATFYAGAASIALYRTDTAHYRDNLASGSPGLWVVLRPTGLEPPFELTAVTADPAEGEGYTQNGDYLVEVVAMPEPVRALIDGFVAEHHVERPFIKRQRDRADPDALARRGPQRKGSGYADRDKGSG